MTTTTAPELTTAARPASPAAPDLAWSRDILDRVRVTELPGPAGLRTGLAMAAQAQGELVAELSGPGWSHVLLLELLEDGGLQVTDLDTGERCRATVRRFVRDLGASVTSTVVVLGPS